MTTRRVAVLGGGIMGSSTALFLARRGIGVVLFDAAAAPFMGASRWNEGKIHLGFLYAGDRSLRTARRILPGGLAFRPLVEELIGVGLTGITEADDCFLVHRDSVVGADDIRAYFDAVAEMAGSHPAAGGYLTDVSRARPRELSRSELAEIAGVDSVVGGFVVPERSISTQWVADRFVTALAADPNIELRLGARVLDVEAESGSLQGPLRIMTDRGSEGPFDAVVNALWEGRPRVDSKLGIGQDDGCSHRYRLALFVRTGRNVPARSAVLCVGAFGDIKNYDGREFYLSWYPTGLVASSEGLDPPPVPHLDSSAREAIADATFDRLTDLLPSVAEIRAQAIDVRVEGGWVFARGRGQISDPASSLHRRHRMGIARRGAYVSVDTGKYSVAPWLALQIADMIAG